MVVISDSEFGTGPDQAAADAYAASIGQDLGVIVSIDSFYYGGSTSSYVLSQIRGNASLRDSVRTADVVLFNVPFGELKSLCPWDSSNSKPAPGTLEEYTSCGATMVEHYAADAEAIVTEIVGLRNPAEAMVRTTTLWEDFYRTLQGLGVAAATHPMYQALNAALERTATAHGVAVADAYTALMGPDGTEDPIAAGDLQADEVHLTDQGVAKLALLLRDLGYSPRSERDASA